MVDREMQTLSIAPLATVFEYDGEPRKEKEIITYSKGVQTSTDWSPPRARGAGGSDSERDDSPTRSPRAKRLSRRQKERDEEIRANLKKEIEEEIKAAQQASIDAGAGQTASKENFPFKTLTNEELAAVENSEDFAGFVERSTKVLERALDQQLGYDILADYAIGGVNVDEEDEGYGSSGGKKGRRIKEVAQFWDERWSKKRMISDLGFSSKVLPHQRDEEIKMLMSCAVPRARPGLLYQEPLRSSRPRRPHPGLESAHARPPRIRLPRPVRHTDSQVFTIPPQSHHRRCILRTGSTLGYARQIVARPEDPSHRIRPHASSLLYRYCRNPEREQYHLLLHRWRCLRLDSGHAFAAPGIPRAQFPTPCQD